FFFFQAEDGIRDRNVTGVQTCALPIYRNLTVEINLFDVHQDFYDQTVRVLWVKFLRPSVKFSGAKELVEQMKQDEIDSRRCLQRSEERRVGKERRSRE